MNIVQIFKKFPDQESCIKHLELARWGNTPICAYCKSDNTYPLRGELRHHCNSCRKSFSVTIGTIFHDTRLPMQKWFLLITLMLNAKKGLSACQAARDIEVRRATVWSMMHRVRKAMADDGTLLAGIVEMDETYVGGKPRKGNDRDDDIDGGNSSKRGRGTDKTPVVGMVQRKGNVKAQSVSKNDLCSTALQSLVRKGIDLAIATLITDEYRGYSGMEKVLPHFTINHSKSYMDGVIHTNTIESFWAIVKRGIVGQFHKVSAKYLDKYLDEFTYRYNVRNRDANTVFAMTLGKLLTA